MVEGSSKLTSNGIGSLTYEETSEPMAEDTAPPPETAAPSLSKSKNVSNEGKEKELFRSSVHRRKAHRQKYINTLQRRKQNQTVSVPLTEIRNCYVLCQRLQLNLNKPNYSMKLTESSLIEQCKRLKVKLRRLALSPKSNKLLSNARRTSNENKKAEEVMNSDSHQEPGKIADFETISENSQTSNGENSLLSNGVHSQPYENSEKIAVKQEDEEGNKLDDGMYSDKAFNEAIMCPHGNLTIEETERKLVPVRVWEILKQYFPSAPSFPHNSEPCRQCQNLASKDEVVKQQYYESALAQKKTLSDLFNLRNRPVLGKTDEMLYILHRQYFHQPWSNFVRSSTRGGALVEPPSSLKVDMLLCVHGLLHFSPEYEEDLARLVLVTQQEWETLTSLYTTDNEVTVLPDFSTYPDLCHMCFAARLEHEQQEKLNYNRARLHIRQVPLVSALEDQESPELFSAKKRSRTEGPESPIPPELKKLMKSAAASAAPGPADVRRSARNRKVAGQKDVQLTVSSNLTLRELKQMITNQLAVAPFDQHLSTLEGRELNGDYNTLSSLGILPNSTLLLQVDEPKGSFDDMLEEECSQHTEPEAGFKGTGLLHAY